MRSLFKKTYLLFIPAFILLLPFFARAACSTSTSLEFVVRDSSGSFVPGAKVEVYRQELDANNQPKPTTRVAYTTVSQTLGMAKLSFRNTEAENTYAIKVQTISKDQAAFWFYDNVLGCGEKEVIEKKLSGILFTLRDASGELLRSTSFNVYTQLYDLKGAPLKERRDLVATLNTGTSGQAKIYVPQGSVRSLDKAKSDHYVLEITRSGHKFYFYDIAVTDGALTGLDYYLSALRVRVQTQAALPYPTGTVVEVYKQDIDEDNNNIKGDKVGSFTLGDNGYGTFETAPGVYALAVKGKTGQYQNFWDLEVEDGRLSEYTLTPDSAFTPSLGTCPSSANLTINLRSYGASVSGLKFEVYEQSTDAYGLPTPGKKVGGGTFDHSGRYNLSFKPDPRMTYALKVWEKRADRGEYWFFDAARFTCGYDRAITKTLPALKVVLRDASGALKRNQSFSLYMQTYDADGKPMADSRNLIANLKTDNSGAATVFVAPFNVYVPSQTGFYAISLKGDGGKTENFYNIRMLESQDYVFESSSSGLSGVLEDAKGNVLGNKNMALYEQKVTGSSYSLGQKLLAFRTDSSGRFKVEYPLGTYALVSLDDYNRSNVFWNVKLTAGGKDQVFTASLLRFRIIDRSSQIRAEVPVTLNLYALEGVNENYKQGAQIGTIKLENGEAAISLAAGPYLVTYVGANSGIYGQAFYAKNGSSYEVKLNLDSKSLVDENSSFYLPGAASALNPGNGQAVAPANSPIVKRLKGRILLQVESQGQAWYVNPEDSRRYFLGRPEDAYQIMRAVSLGISNNDFKALQNNPQKYSNLAGRILLKVEDNGRAYYFDPSNLNLYYLGRPEDAFKVMRERGLGITNNDLGQISTGN